MEDNPEHFWFKRKAFGWGWVPATWHGWLSLAVFVIVFALINIAFISDPEKETNDITVFLVEVATWVVALIGLCLMTGEDPKWQWGIPEEKDREDA